MLWNINKKTVVVLLTKKEARALQYRLGQNTGTKKSKILLSAEDKLNIALDSTD